MHTRQKWLRIIPRLDIKGPNLVKGVHLEGLRVLGKPEVFAKHYYENGADEILFMDVVASLYERNSLHDLISNVARDIFVPLIVGGGLRSLEDIEKVLHAGADKVSLNTAVTKNPELINQAAKRYGASTIVVTIETIKDKDGIHRAYIDNGREQTGLSAFDWAKQAADRGAGEILLTSVDKEGTGEGMDITFLKQVSNCLSIPVIAHGGIGNLKHLSDICHETHIDALAMASLFHYDCAKGLFDESISSGGEGNTSFIENYSAPKSISTATIQAAKLWLSKKDLPCRMSGNTGDSK